MKNKLNKTNEFQNLKCAFAQIAIKDFENPENLGKIFCLLNSSFHSEI